MSESFRLYKVLETKDMSAEELQLALNNATEGFPEMQIDHVIGTKIIFGYESSLNAKGRAEAKLKKLTESAIHTLVTAKALRNTR